MHPPTCYFRPCHLLDSDGAFLPTPSLRASRSEEKQKDMAQPWSKDVKQVLQSHSVDPAKGLTLAQVEKLRKEYGPNELDKEEG